MKGGFSFCGTDIGDIGLEYAPELEDTYVYQSAKARIHEEVFDGHDGGYYYGTSKEPKEFTLRCIFDEKNIDRGLMAKVDALFRKGKSGKLVFDRRPWCYYIATVTDVDFSGIMTYFSGMITIHMKAYYPFARSDVWSITKQNKDYFRMVENTAFPESEDMLPQLEFCQEMPITDETEFYLMNPGTEKAHVGIEIAGNSGRGIIITNETLGQSCRIVAMSESVFNGDTSYLYVDGLNGKTVLVKDGTSAIAFLYHDEGFIELAPAFPVKRQVYLAARGNVVQCVNKMYDRLDGQSRDDARTIYVGKHIWAGNSWHEITDVGLNHLTDMQNEHIFVIGDEIKEEVSNNSMICQLNKITIKPVSEMKITRLKFVYKPTFA